MQMRLSLNPGKKQLIHAVRTTHNVCRMCVLVILISLLFSQFDDGVGLLGLFPVDAENGFSHDGVAALPRSDGETFLDGENHLLRRASGT